MKKFLSKLPTMIVLIVLSVSMLALTMFVALRPVDYGDKYKSTLKTNVYSNGFEYIGQVNVSFQFEQDDVLSIDYRTETSDSATLNLRIIRNGKNFVILGTEYEVSSAEKNSIEEMLNTADKAAKDSFYSTHAYGRVSGYSLRLENNSLLHKILISAVENDPDTDLYNTLNVSNINNVLDLWYFNSNYVPRVIINALVDIVLIIFSTISTILFIKRKKA